MLFLLRACKKFAGWEKFPLAHFATSPPTVLLAYSTAFHIGVFQYNAIHETYKNKEFTIDSTLQK
jgi:hypothetical protein